MPTLGSIEFVSTRNAWIGHDGEVERPIATDLGERFAEVDLGSLPDAAVKSVAHGVVIDFSKKVILVGSAREGSSSIPLPYTQDAPLFLITLSLDATNVNVKSNFDASGKTGKVFLGYA